MSRKLAIVQARMGSTRLPGKVLAPILGKPTLERMVERLRFVRGLDGIAIATTDGHDDDVIAGLAERLGCLLFRGSRDDVLDRYYQAAIATGADPVIRVTADCPLIDPELTEGVLAAFVAGDFDFMSLTGGFPDGFDTEVISQQALRTAWKEAKLPSEREHVTPYIWKSPDRFRIGSWEFPGDAGHLRLTVDEPADLKLVRIVYQRLYSPGCCFGWREILRLLEQEQDLARINAGITRNFGYQRSLAAEEAGARR